MGIVSAQLLGRAVMERVRFDWKATMVGLRALIGSGIRMARLGLKCVSGNLWNYAILGRHKVWLEAQCGRIRVNLLLV